MEKEEELEIDVILAEVNDSIQATVDDMLAEGEEASGMSTEAHKEEKKPKKHKVLRWIAKGILIVIALLVIVVTVFVGSIVLTSDSKVEMIAKFASNPIGNYIIQLLGSQIYEENIHKNDIDDSKIIVNEPEEKKPESSVLSEKYTTFALFGIESYDEVFDNATHSDSIMIVSINKETKEVNLSSVYRDTCLSIVNRDGGDEDYFSKVNAAYFVGGALSAINTLNVNLDLHITDYATINWGGVATVIDALGGVDINLTEDEVYQLNYHMGATASGIGEAIDYVESAGWNHLNGVQATTYCRIRKTAFYDPDTGEEINDDFGRAARQQYMIKLLIQKAKNANLSQLLNLVRALFGTGNKGEQIFATSLTLQEVLELVPVLMDFELGGTYGFPETKLTPTVDGASLVVPADLAYNVELLHEFLYPDISYSLSGTVWTISEELAYYTDVPRIERREKEDSEDDMDGINE